MRTLVPLCEFLIIYSCSLYGINSLEEIHFSLQSFLDFGLFTRFDVGRTHFQRTVTHFILSQLHSPSATAKVLGVLWSCWGIPVHVGAGGLHHPDDACVGGKVPLG